MPAPTEISSVIIGAGHAGLAMSCRLTERSIDHIVLERGEVANSWKTERWDALRLLTPNWQTQLPGMSYGGDDPHGYMTMGEIADFITDYASIISAPVRTHTTVTRLSTCEGRYRVETDDQTWCCHTVVIASGGSNVANMPACAAELPRTIKTVSPMTYRSPEHLDDRGVLVVGASATGVQLADEIHRSGRPVTISVGEHVRLPRTYRGRDIFWWLDATGISDERHTEVDDLVRARNLPSPQLVGTPEHRSLDLNALSAAGIEIVGRLARITGSIAQFSGSLPNVCTMADLKMNRLLDTFDQWAETAALCDLDPPQRFQPTIVPSPPRLELDLVGHSIGTVIWATGYRPDYSWLDLPVLDRKGRISHDGGVVTGAPGVYVTGLNVLRRRRSSFIHGSSQDSEELSDHLQHHLGTVPLTRGTS